MYCVNCGAEIKDNSNYCSICGQDLSKYQEKTSSNVDIRQSDVNLKGNKLKTVLHEPVAPYLTNEYNIINHLVQGLVLAAIFYVISIYWGQLTLPIALKIIYCIGFVITIWHGNMMYQQYVVVRASILSTLIPIIMGILQCILALAVTEPIYIFTLLIIPLKIMIIILIWEQNHKYKKPLAFEIWKEHYNALGSQFAQDMFDEFIKFGKVSIRQLSIIVILTGILTLFNYFAPLDLSIKTYISFIILVIFLIMSNYFDLNHYFNNSEKLKKYGYEW